MKNTQRGPASTRRLRRGGFTLLIAVIFMSVMLAFGLELASLAYKQQVLASSAIESQYAFYAADAGLECALYADQQLNTFDYASHDSSHHPNLITCDGTSATELPGYSYSTGANGLLYVAERLSLDSSTLTPHCAYVTVYKYNTPQSPHNMTTYIFSQGYDVSCSVVASPNGARFLSRGLSAYH